ncbi:MAG: Alkaline phosphatase synthesis transcriptional regulatory protein PhoP [Bacteroidetes bacterium ADurb.Bin408]|nr:MAG: Alkaline phosphatase synthesis transcriptional regulatory protein PhoP [Bacteroidetes bacterium ADurb.Bin408]
MMENNNYTILLVDDEPDILEFLGYNLRREGYRVVTCNNGKEAIKLAKKERPHLIILDVMMPEMDGIETCNELKTYPELKHTIIAFLTARGEDYSQIAGFEAGADDYISKPIRPKVFTSRVKALLRRFERTEAEKENVLTIGSLTIDKEKYKVTFNGTEHILPRKEFELLLLLASKPNKVFTRNEIFSNVWGNQVIVGDRTIDVHVRKIREKLNCNNIKTIKGVGYKYENQ